MTLGPLEDYLWTSGRISEMFALHFNDTSVIVFNFNYNIVKAMGSSLCVLLLIA